MRLHPQRLALEALEDRTLMSTCHVTRLSDIGAGQGFRGDLRYCINKVNTEPGPDVIDFSVTGTINLTSRLPDLNTEIDIQGPGADLLTIRRGTGGNYRILTVNLVANVHLTGLTVADGLEQVQAVNTAYGGGIWNSGGLTVSACVITRNRASSLNESTYGGGIFNSGQLTLIDSSVVANRVSADILGYGGGIHNLGSASIYNSTIANNVADGFIFPVGGAISNRNGSLVLFNSTVASNNSLEGAAIVTENSGFVLISHSTISRNYTTFSNEGKGGGGIYIENSAVFMRNSIVAGNTAYDVFGTLAGSDHNLIGNTTNGSGFGPTDLLNVTPRLSPLADNGGPTLTMAPLPGSPAIDAGDNTNAPEFDQRGPGFPRIVNGTIDIGAFEVQATAALPIVRTAAALSFEHLIMLLATTDLDSLT